MKPKNINEEQPLRGQRVLLWHPKEYRWVFGTYWTYWKTITTRTGYFAGPPTGYVEATFWLPEPDALQEDL